MAPSALEGSVPDIDIPPKMSDPIGTPRRNGSLTGSQPINGHSATNGNYGAIGSRITSYGFGSSSRVNSPSPVASSSSGSSNTNSLWARFQQMKFADTDKNALLQEVLTRFSYLEQEHADLVKQVEADRKRQESSQDAELYKSYYMQLSGMIHRQPFLLVLIDGDGMIFHNYLLRLGEQGGKQAADLLHKAVSEWARSAMEQLPKEFKVVTRIYANLKGLAETCRRAGIVSATETVEDFARGFTNQKSLFNFIDVGPGKDRADEKIKAEFRLYMENCHCRHILLGCSHDNGFARLLEEFSFDSVVCNAVTLMEGVPFEKELAALPYGKKKFEDIFRDTKINLNPPDLLTGFPRMRQDSKNNFNPASGIFTPSSRTPAPETPAFSPRSGPGFASPALSIRGDLSRTNSIASSNAVSDALPTPSGGIGGGSGWANIARGSAHLPFKDLTRPPSETPKLPAKIIGPVVQQNKLGQRVDATMEYDHDRVYELKKMKYCNQHYIGRGCCHWEAGNGACPHKHDTKLSNSDLKWLKVVARETVCKKGTACMDFDCIYGHHCPYPKMTEGSMRGVGCINGEKCRFAREMHGMDMNVVKVLRAQDDEV